MEKKLQIVISVLKSKGKNARSELVDFDVIRLFCDVITEKPYRVWYNRCRMFPASVFNYVGNNRRV